VPTTNRENESTDAGSNVIDSLVRYALGGGLPQLIFILGLATVTLAFFVGEDREDSLLNTYNKVHSNQDRIPPVVSQWFRRRIPDRAASWSGPYCLRTASRCQACTPACRFPRETAHAC
jgi:hypothetical protein